MWFYWHFALTVFQKKNENKLGYMYNIDSMSFCSCTCKMWTWPYLFSPFSGNMNVILHFIPFFRTFLLTYILHLCMHLKCVAYNRDELLFRKLSFWVWLKTRRVTKRDTLELATLWYLLWSLFQLLFEKNSWKKFVKQIGGYIWWIYKKSCGGQGTILINKLSNRCRNIDLHTCVHHGHFQ